jgi:hypothetical protein
VGYAAGLEAWQRERFLSLIGNCGCASLTKDIRHTKVKPITSVSKNHDGTLEHRIFMLCTKVYNIYKVQKIFVKHFSLFTCSTFTTHLYLLFIIITKDRNALSEPGNEIFISAS